MSEQGNDIFKLMENDARVKQRGNNPRKQKMAEGYLEAAETVDCCCNDQIFQWWSVIKAPLVARWEEELTRSSGGKRRHRTAIPADVPNSTTTRDTKN